MVWENPFGNPAKGLSSPTAMVVDVGGNAIVTGRSRNRPGFPRDDLYTVKYGAADGAVLWEQFFDAANGGDDNPAAIALDSHGSVVVAGTSATAEDGIAFYSAAAYAAVDGSVVWEKSYMGPEMGHTSLWDQHSLATGPNGMVALTGTSNDDFATVVYHERPRPGSFADWAAGFGLSAAAATTDSDGDGLPGAVEYILGGDPSAPSTSERPTATIVGDNWLFTFRRDDSSETPGVTLTVESGTDLVTWRDVFTIGSDTAGSSPGVTITESGPARDTITVSLPRDGDLPRYARLKVAITP